MNRQSPVSTAGKLTVAALLVAAGGFELQMVSGVTNAPTILPGLVTLLVAAGLVALLSWWWMPVVGALAGLLAKACPISRAGVAATLLNLVQDATTARSAVNVGGGFHGDVNGSGLLRHTDEYNTTTHRVGGV